MHFHNQILKFHFNFLNNLIENKKIGFTYGAYKLFIIIESDRKLTQMTKRRMFKNGSKNQSLLLWYHQFKRILLSSARFVVMSDYGDDSQSANLRTHVWKPIQ